MSEVAAQTKRARPRRFRPYPEYRDSGVEWLGEIPAHWEVNRLRTTVTGCQNGVWGEEADEVHDLVCVRVADFDRVRFRVRLDAPTMRSIDTRLAQTRRLEERDLLLEKSGGGDKQPVGAVVMYDHREPAVCSNFVARMPVADGCDPRYLTYLHAALYAARINTRSIKQSTGIQNLDSESYLNESVGLARGREQRAIADFLDRETAKIDALVAKKERLIELLQEKRTALITRAVTRGLDPNVPMKDSGVEWLGEIPKHWEAGALSRWWTVLDCKHRTVPFLDEGIAVASIGEVHGLKVDLSDANRTSVETYEKMIKGGREPRIGDIIYSRNATVGEAAIVDNDVPFCMGQDVSLIRSVSEQPLFLLHTLRSRVMLAQLETLMVGSTFKRINVGQIKKLFVVVPPRSEQEDIAHYAAEVYGATSSLIGRVREAIDILNEFRTALISAAVTGKIDVREAVSL